MPVGQMPVEGATVFGPEYYTDTQGRASLHVWSAQWPLPETTKDRTPTKDTLPIPGQKLKFLIPPRIKPGPPDWKAGTLPTTPRRRIR